MSKKTTETKLEKQAAKKPPIELSEDQLDKAQGGGAVRPGGRGIFSGDGVPPPERG